MGYGMRFGQVDVSATAPRADGRVRLWVDRSFTIRGSGTVVTGTLAAGTLSVGDTLDLDGQLCGSRGCSRWVVRLTRCRRSVEWL